jgi:hypothetical protein
MPDIFSSNILSKPPSLKNTPENSVPLKKNNFIRETENMMIYLPKKHDVHKLPGHTHNPLTAYCFYPDKIHFANADAEEKIVAILRKHPITNLPWIITIFLMILTPAFFPVLPFVGSVPELYSLVFTLIWYLVTMAVVIEKFLNWFFNVDLITDERILDVNFHNIMYREITAANIDEIQEVTIKPMGGIASFFDYGDVYIQTAAEIPRIVFYKVPHPEKVERILRELGIEEQIEKIEGRVR